MHRKRILCVAIATMCGIMSGCSVSNAYAVENKSVLTSEDARKISEGEITLEDGRVDSLLYQARPLDPKADDDEDGLLNEEEIYIYEKNGKKYIGYNSHPRLKDTDGDGIVDGQDKNPLAWDVTPRDLAMFMELVYREDSYIQQVLDPTRRQISLYNDRLEYAMMHKELSPYWAVKETYHLRNGFDAVLFETKATLPYTQHGNVQVLAIRGTSQVNDYDDDLAITVGMTPGQVQSVNDILRSYQSNQTVNQLYITGHSLGGYLAERGAIEAYQKGYKWLKKVVTFNAPGIRSNLSTRELKRIENRLAKQGTAIHYIVNNDRLSSLVGYFSSPINIGNTVNGHGSRSYFEGRLTNVPGFSVGERTTMNGTGYREKNADVLRYFRK